LTNGGCQFVCLHLQRRRCSRRLFDQRRVLLHHLIELRHGTIDFLNAARVHRPRIAISPMIVITLDTRPTISVIVSLALLN
jgi:hypothetical protein